MTTTTTLRPMEDGVFRIVSPAHCAALTRSDGKASTTLCDRIDAALGGVYGLEFKRGGSGAWYVREVGHDETQDRNELTAHECTLDIGPVCEWNRNMADHSITIDGPLDTYDDVDDNDYSHEGNHACGKCAGSGQYITHTLNGKAAGPGGNCYRCSGKGYHNTSDRARNAKFDSHFNANAA